MLTNAYDAISSYSDPSLQIPFPIEKGKIIAAFNLREVFNEPTIIIRVADNGAGRYSARTDHKYYSAETPLYFGRAGVGTKHLNAYALAVNGKFSLNMRIEDEQRTTAFLRIPLSAFVAD